MKLKGAAQKQTPTVPTLTGGSLKLKLYPPEILHFKIIVLILTALII